MRAQVQVCSNGTLVLKAEQAQDLGRFELGDTVEVSLAAEPEPIDAGSAYAEPDEAEDEPEDDEE